ncbi:MAG: segregation/condensation protein A, partial [Deltaproteobacteria bacterium]
MRTREFDGPLELLLYLVRRQGIDVRALQVAPITDAYLAQLELMQALDLDTAGEFLVMAATLCWLKSRELLPQRSDDVDEEEEEDPRERLIRRLVDYERYREASERLGQLPMLGRDTFARPAVPLDPSERPVEPGVDAMGLLEIFYGVLQRHSEPPVVHEVELEPYSLREMAGWILDRLESGPRSLSDLLSQLEHRLDRVVAFLASLEMARLQLIDIQQSHHLAP